MLLYNYESSVIDNTPRLKAMQRKSAMCLAHTGRYLRGAPGSPWIIVTMLAAVPEKVKVSGTPAYRRKGTRMDIELPSVQIVANT
jgi:hypothetical protein